MLIRINRQYLYGHDIFLIYLKNNKITLYNIGIFAFNSYSHSGFSPKTFTSTTFSESTI